MVLSSIVTKDSLLELFKMFLRLGDQFFISEWIRFENEKLKIHLSLKVVHPFSEAIDKYLVFCMYLGEGLKSFIGLL